MNVYKCVACMYSITFMDVEFHHTSGQLAGDTYSCTFHLTFNIVVGTVHEYETNDCDYQHRGHHHGHGYQ